MGLVDVAHVGAGDHGWDSEHNDAERALVLGSHRVLGLVDDRPRSLRVGRRQDHRPENALDQVEGHQAPSRPRQGLSKQPVRFAPVALQQSDLGESLQ